MNEIKAFKLFRVRRDGSLGSLFIDRKAKIPLNQWQEAREIPTPGYAFRPGFHACTLPFAPHLSMNGRVWHEVLLRGYEEFNRPAHQGGRWYIAKHMKVLGPVEDICERASESALNVMK